MPSPTQPCNVRILVAPDKFKGSLTAHEAVEAICLGIERALPEAHLHRLPLADGGEGTAEVFVNIFGGGMVECETTDALGRPIRARYGWTPSLHQAVIEMSAASGLWRLREDERDPLRATTFGTGTLLIDAARRGAKKILVGLGGSATNDAGAGLAAALGHRFLDAGGTPLTPAPETFPEIVRIERSSRIFAPEILALSDVRNPLLGPEGASRIYGPQKGATPAMVETLDRNLTHLADLVQRDLHCDFRDAPGAGAAGGLGFGLLSFCQAALRPGFDTFADLTGLDQLIGEIDLVITGEGLLDPQTLEGKGPGGIARRARKAGKPVIAFAGAIRGEDRLDDVFDACFGLANGPMTAAESMRDARDLLVRAAERVARVLSLSQKS
ncbi:MAG: glycerate kinase [Terrimicrobiaceae bacterium]|nr:glycerate kinase [Terrimicrobiaceae bacterium]